MTSEAFLPSLTTPSKRKLWNLRLHWHLPAEH